ncbi:MAG TPA: hypothetical protein PLI95_16690, partial [Polyangiaceae bacterium]|nr:hypothetical protein [Polyangiaceae bacterium]
MTHYLVSGAVVLSGILGLCMLSGAHREAPLVGHQKFGPEVSTLEAQVARQPHDAPALASLAQHYLDRGAPGMAIAALARAPEPVRSDPSVSHVWAVALLHEGNASQALDQEDRTLAACSRLPCSPWLVASALRHREFASALVAGGVEDYRRDPDATLLAYGRVSRNLVAVLDPAALD